MKNQRNQRKELIPLSDWLLVGYSNGANIAAHLLLERETELNKGLFFHPMSLGVHQSRSTLEDKTVWISYGDNDPIVSLLPLKNWPINSKHAKQM